MEDQKRIIEINGVKMEVDLRNAKVIENYKVGDSIKVLVKGYGDNYESHLGTIIAFDNYKETPTIVIAYLKVDYNGCKICFVYYNKQTKDVEITALNDWGMPVTKAEVIKSFRDEMAKKEQELKDIEQKKQVFEKMFGKYFEAKEVVQ